MTRLLPLVSQQLEGHLLVTYHALYKNLRWSQHAYEMYYAETVLLQSKHHGNNVTQSCAQKKTCITATEKNNCKIVQKL